MALISLNEINISKALESTDPKPFEAVILGTLIVAENPHPLYAILKTKISSKMFSETLQPIATLIFDMVEMGNPLRKYKILEKAAEAKILLSIDDIETLRHQHAESDAGDIATEDDFSSLCTTFVDKWYLYALNESALTYNADIQKQIAPLTAFRDLQDRNEAIDNLKAGAKDEESSIYAAAAKYVEVVERRMTDPDFYTGLTTGIYSFDRMTGGLEGGDLIAACGFAGKGKTTITYQMLSNISKSSKVDILSLETSAMNLSAKSLAMQTGISTIDMKTGKVTPEDIAKMKQSLIAISNQKLDVFTKIFHIDDIERFITLRVRKKGVTCVVIDNLTMIRHNYKGGREDAETKITYRLKELAMLLDIPIIIIVHQNKDSLSRADKEPTTSDIKFAGGGVAFDIVFFPYTVKGETDPFALEVSTSLVVTKSRNGGLTGAIPMIFVKSWEMYCEEGEDGRAILPNQPKKSETTDGKSQNSNIITQRGDPDILPF